MITFNTDNMLLQSFPFPATIMDYIFKNLEPQHLLKLYKCSKFFYAKFRLNMIQHLKVFGPTATDGAEETFHPSSTALSISNPNLSILRSFWITESFVARGLPILMVSFPQFSRCTITKLELCEYILWKDYYALTKEGTIEDLKITGVCGDYGLLPIEDIVAQVPKAKSIVIGQSIITPSTFTSLMSLNHKAKITNFELGNITSLQLYKNKVFTDFFLFLCLHETQLITVCGSRKPDKDVTKSPLLLSVFFDKYLNYSILFQKNADYDCYVYLDFKLMPQMLTNKRIFELSNFYSYQIMLALQMEKRGFSMH